MDKELIDVLKSIYFEIKRMNDRSDAEVQKRDQWTEKSKKSEKEDMEPLNLFMEDMRKYAAQNLQERQEDRKAWQEHMKIYHSTKRGVEIEN